ncbi:unnamed protein product, partial [Pocillopora meandrina]
MQPSTTSSVAQRGIFPPPSGGLVPICKRQWHAPKGLQNDRRRLSTHKYSFCKLDGDSCPKPKDFFQDNKKFRPTSCLDYLLKGASACGMYRLYDSSGNSFPAYCDLKSEPGFA